jgi:hypothetical protein
MDVLRDNLLKAITANANRQAIGDNMVALRASLPQGIRAPSKLGPSLGQNTSVKVDLSCSVGKLQV